MAAPGAEVGEARRPFARMEAERRVHLRAEDAGAAQREANGSKASTKRARKSPSQCSPAPGSPISPGIPTASLKAPGTSSLNSDTIQRPSSVANRS